MSQQKALTSSQVYVSNAVDLSGKAEAKLTLNSPFRLGVSRIVGIQYYLDGAPTVPVVASNNWYINSITTTSTVGLVPAYEVSLFPAAAVAQANLRGRILYVNESVSSDAANLLQPC